MKKMTLLMGLLFLAGLGFSGTVTFDHNWGVHPLFNITSTRATGIDVTFSMFQMVSEEQVVDGVTMATYAVPAVFIPVPGAPNLGGVSRWLAIPQGARAEVEILASRTQVYHNVEVAPASNIPKDNDDAPLKYEKNLKIYGMNAYWPPSPVVLSERTDLRGVDVVMLCVMPFQYNPVTKELIVYQDIKFRVNYVGGSGHFGVDRLRSRLWEPVLENNLLNYRQLPKINFYSPERLNARAGFEYIIIVPDDATFIAWGDTLKRWRKLQGISTEVYTTTQCGGNDSAHIKTFLQNAYSTWNPAPTAFLILSDFNPSGDVYGIPATRLNLLGEIVASDNWYADMNSDNIPDLDHGRICAQTNAQLDTIIHKMLAVERNPSTNAGFYSNPIVAAAWQDERWFQLAGETVRQFLMLGLGKTPARLYAIYGGTPTPGCPWSTNPATKPVVMYWHNVGWLPDTLNQGDAAWWSTGNNTAITNAINAGAWFVQHRDHGAETAWGEPAYSNSDVYNLTNTNSMYPYINSSNCLTGEYIYSGECMTERFMRDAHCAVGVNGASEVSYSFVNDAYIWGIWDGLFPKFDPGYPNFDMTGYDNLRPCQAMTHGKIYLYAMWFGDSAFIKLGYDPAPYKQITAHLFHHHGDCFMTLYSQIPMTLSVSHASSIGAGQTTLDVTANDSSIIALTVNYEIIGVAEGTGVPVTITFPGQLPNDTVVVTVTKANYYRYVAKVAVIDAGMPAMPTVIKPLDFGRLPYLNPTLTFTSTDPQSDQIIYRVMWDTDPTFASPESSTTAGYLSGATVNFNFPSSLTNGITYWWKVKCTDVGGSGYWTGYTVSRSFTVDTSLPATTCSWYQTTAAQFGFNTFNSTLIQGDSVVLVAMGSTVVESLQVQKFEAGSMPSGWTVVNGNGDAYQWTVGTTSDLSSPPPNYGTYYAYYSDDDAGSGVINNNEELLSPKWYVGGLSGSVVMEYGWGFQVYQAGEKYRVKFRKKTGAGAWTAWADKKVYTSSGSGTDTIPLSAELPCDSIQFDWFYSDSTASSHWGYANAMDNALLRRTYTLSNDYGTMTGSLVDYKELSKTNSRTKWGWMVFHKAAAGDSIGVQVEYYNGATWQLVPNGTLPGNSTGFFKTAAYDSVNLSGLDTSTYRNLRLKSSFYRKAKAPTNPALLDWEVGNLNGLIAVAEQTSGDKTVFGLSLMPNPSSKRITIHYALSTEDPAAQLRIFDAAGRLVKSFDLSSAYSVVPSVITWQGDDDLGRSVPAGVYFIRLESDGQEKIEKAILLR